jgi:hypothetical protein
MSKELEKKASRLLDLQWKLDHNLISETEKAEYNELSADESLDEFVEKHIQKYQSKFLKMHKKQSLFWDAQTLLVVWIVVLCVTLIWVKLK